MAFSKNVENNIWKKMNPQLITLKTSFSKINMV